MKNQKWNKILLADEIAGICYYLVSYAEIKQLVVQFGPLITTISLMIAALLIARAINLIMNAVVSFYYRMTHYYQKQVLGSVLAIEFYILKSRMNEKSIHQIFINLEKKAIDYIDDQLIFYRELFRSLMVMGCFHAMDCIFLYTSWFDLLKILGLFVLSLVSSVLFSKFDMDIKKASIHYSYEKMEGRFLNEI